MYRDSLETENVSGRIQTQPTDEIQLLEEYRDGPSRNHQNQQYSYHTKVLYTDSLEPKDSTTQKMYGGSSGHKILVTEGECGRKDTEMEVSI